MSQKTPMLKGLVDINFEVLHKYYRNGQVRPEIDQFNVAFDKVNEVYDNTSNTNVFIIMCDLFDIGTDRRKEQLLHPNGEYGYVVDVKQIPKKKRKDLKKRGFELTVKKFYSSYFIWLTDFLVRINQECYTDCLFFLNTGGYHVHLEKPVFTNNGYDLYIETLQAIDRSIKEKGLGEMAIVNPYGQKRVFRRIEIDRLLWSLEKGNIKRMITATGQQETDKDKELIVNATTQNMTKEGKGFKNAGVLTDFLNDTWLNNEEVRTKLAERSVQFFLYNPMFKNKGKEIKAHKVNQDFIKNNIPFYTISINQDDNYYNWHSDFSRNIIKPTQPTVATWLV